MSAITLTATERQTLLSLNQVTQLQSTTQERLNTGKKVNSATDNAVAYFRSQSLYNRSTEIQSAKSSIDQSIQTLEAALTATTAVESLLGQLKGVLENARGASLNARISATAQFGDIGLQLAQLVKDASYQGLNILTSTNANLTTQFSERTASTFVINGYNLLGVPADAPTTGPTTWSARALFTAANFFNADGSVFFDGALASTHPSAGSPLPWDGVYGFSNLDVISGSTSGDPSTWSAAASVYIFNGSELRLNNAIAHIQAIASSLGTNVDILQSRADFSTAYSNVLTDGGDKLTLADLNTEAANSSALSLRQQLGIQSLTTSATQNASILTLLKSS